MGIRRAQCNAALKSFDSELLELAAEGFTLSEMGTHTTAKSFYDGCMADNAD